MTYYLDTGVFVTPILKNQSPEVIRSCLQWQDRAARGEIAACTSYLTWDEVTYIAGRAAGRPFNAAAAGRTGDLLLRLRGLMWLEVDEGVVRRAQDMLAWPTPRPLRPRDCIHASAALIHADGQMVTLDADFEPTPGAPVPQGLQVTRIM